MTDIDKAKAVLAVCANFGIALSGSDRAQIANSLRAMIAKAEQADEFEQFKRQVSDKVEALLEWPSIRLQEIIVHNLSDLILPKPVDPLVEACTEAHNKGYHETEAAFADDLRAALAARGGKIVWENQP